VLESSKDAPRVCCGTWIENGQYYVFQISGGPKPQNDLWIVRENHGLFRGKPIRLTNGPISLSNPTSAGNSDKLFAVGELSRGQLVKFDRVSRSFMPFLGGISAMDVSFSNDGRWAAYVRYPEKTLWKSKTDGSEAFQITKPPLAVFQPHWSPGGTEIGFLGQMTGKPWKAYVVDAGGGVPRELKPDDRNDQGVPTWAPDGRSILFGELLYRKPDTEMAVHIIERGGRRETILSGSEGKWSPRWSPDGRYIVAQSPNGERLFFVRVPHQALERNSSVSQHLRPNLVARQQVHLLPRQHETPL